MKRVAVDQVGPGMVALLGVPWDEQSSFLRGAALGPGAIREALGSPSTNWSTESGRDLDGEPRFVDLGDLELTTGQAVLGQIERAAAEVMATGASLIALGGDHAVTYPLVRGSARVHGPLDILHLDAHPDLYDEFEGNRYSHACPFARILEEGLARRLVQIGIRTMNGHQRAQAERYHVNVMEMKAWRPDAVIALDGPVYLSLDLDALDPAFAPGVSHHEPGGLSTRDVLRIVQTFGGRLVAADVVELNPRRDAFGVTALVAAKLVKEIAARLLHG
jgi:agmatinase